MHSMHDDFCARAKPRQQTVQRFGLKGNASCRREETIARDMDKDGAPASGNARPVIVIDLDDEVVETVGALEVVAGLAGRAADRTVVAAVGRVLAPGVVVANPTPPYSRD